ncbi:MAG: superoxide dismutase family protein, partial [Deltaproteobacteria bacterium]|nr:superoxide dismutase family protein [Deltaproteobacteria bacterium]
MKQLLLASTVFASLLAGSAMADDAKPKSPPVPAKPVTPKKAPKSVTVKLTDAKGKSIGTATLSADPGGVKIALAVTGLAPGDHAIHVHQTAKCEAPDFKSAGGHFNPEHKKHGHDNPEGAHAGDMPNLTVDAKGASKSTVLAPGVTLEE